MENGFDKFLCCSNRVRKQRSFINNSYFPGVKGIVETETLEASGTIVNPVTKELEFIRGKELAYFY